MREHYNPHWNSLKNKNIGYKFCSHNYNIKVDAVIKNIYEECKDFMIPFMQNDIVNYGFHNHRQTVGRYDVNSSMNYNMTENEKAQAGKLYSAKNCDEWPFFIREVHVSVVISKGGSRVNLIFEDPSEAVARTLRNNRFTKMPRWNTYYLTDGFIKPKHAIEKLKLLNKVI